MVRLAGSNATTFAAGLSALALQSDLSNLLNDIQLVKSFQVREISRTDKS